MASESAFTVSVSLFLHEVGRGVADLHAAEADHYGSSTEPAATPPVLS